MTPLEGRRRPDLRGRSGQTCWWPGAGASQGGSKVQINHLSAGRVSGRRHGRASGWPSPFLQGESISLELNATDFSTAQAVTDAINTDLGEGTAHCAGRPRDRRESPHGSGPGAWRFMAQLENLQVAAGRTERPGVIVNGAPPARSR